MNPEITFDAPVSTRTARSSARYLTTASRVLLGIIFFVFGLNGFWNFIPSPPVEEMPEFGRALFHAGYMIPLIKGTEVTVGVLLLSNRFVPLALALIAPVVVNIVAFHLFIAPEGLVMAAIVLALELHLAWAHRAAYRSMLQAQPHA